MFGLSIINHLDIGITLWQPSSGRPSHSPIVGDHIGAAPAQRSVGQSRAGTFEAPRREGGLCFFPYEGNTEPIGSMYAIYGNMVPINIPQMLAYIPAPWIRHGEWKGCDDKRCERKTR